MRRYAILIVTLFISCSAIHKAQKSFETGDFASAVAKCQRTIEQDSLNAEAHFILGKCYHAQGQLVQAIEALCKAYEITPETAVTRSAKTELIFVRIEYADSLFHRQQDASAKQELNSVLSLDSTNTPALLRLGNYYYERGLLDKSSFYYRLIAKNDSGRAPATAQLKVIEQRTTKAQQHFVQGNAFYQKYQYRNAVEQFEEALNNKPDHRDAKYYMALSRGAILYNQRKRTELWDAIEEFGKAMTLKPESGEAHYYLGLAYEKKNREEFDNAIDEYKRALEKEPDGWFARVCQKKVKELTRKRDILRKFWGK
ncbi:tetratricopeptide repeat protein [candidate division KSB1 bacterium]|nr:tetratricopeptide repeat protein [candidate division KSB1 bacterium]